MDKLLTRQLFDPNEWNDRTKKSELAARKSVHRQTIHRYHQLAYECVDGFQNDYRLPSGKIFTEQGLSKYQVWVLIILLEAKQRGLHLNILKDELVESLETQRWFSKANFQELYPEVSSEDRMLCYQ